MLQNHEDYHKTEDKISWWKTPRGIVLIFFLAVAGYLLIKEHAAHIGSNWIWLLLLLCPLMHVFMHGGHGGYVGHGQHRHHDDDDNDREA